ncbi:MAG TPA: hypothetical protein VFZ08_01010 [Terriglobia bacterium]|nr:hypothetical protein [Terriglobia bacterium]
MSETRPGVETPPPPIHRHEPRDANVRNLAFLGLGLLGLIVFGFIVTEIAFHYYVGHGPAKEPSTLFTRQQMPPPPLLQEHSGLELQQYLKQEDQKMDSYGWVDRKAGVVRIPISRAMDLLLEKGLPVRPAGQVTRAVSQPHMTPRGDFAPPPSGVPGPQNQ